MNIYTILLSLIIAFSPENNNGKYSINQTVNYEEAINAYKTLDKKYPEAMLLEKGLTDVGKPLHLFLISVDKDFNLASIKKKNKRIILINNGIHAGEPDGIDASIRFAEDILSGTINKSLLQNTIIAIIPVYNIDGALNRGCCSRANQNGPEEYGFRGNARNLDLNRDFIKCDSENAKSFERIFRELDPDILVDTHVSDGADYQYVMTLITTQHNKIHPVIGEFLKKNMEPALFKMMEAEKYPMSPYVETLGRTPETGIVEFLETPRFSTGYSTLFNTLGFVTETHMWKPYKDRVLSTYSFLKVLLEFTARNSSKIGELRITAKKDIQQKKVFPIEWKLDTTQYSEFDFKGYESAYKKSNISGLQRLYYDRAKPFTKKIKFYDNYQVTKEVTKPKYYIVPQAWKEVIDRLRLNKIEMKVLSKDTLLEPELYYISNYKTSDRPYEGHYPHYEIELKKEKQKIQYFKGDVLIATGQPGDRYIVETLEPNAPDSYFTWNFFDSILQQKEGFSDYIFEEKAEEILASNPELQKELKEKQSSDTAFAANHYAQLSFIYKRSKFYEKSHLRYPIGRID